MIELELGVCWVGTDEHPPCSNDSLDQDRIVEVVEGMNADTVALLKALCSKACNELPYKDPGLACRDCSFRVDTVDVDLTLLLAAFCERCPMLLTALC